MLPFPHRFSSAPVPAAVNAAALEHVLYCSLPGSLHGVSLLSGIFLLPVATQSHQIKISMNRKQI